MGYAVRQGNWTFVQWVFTGYSRLSTGFAAQPHGLSNAPSADEKAAEAARRSHDSDANAPVDKSALIRELGGGGGRKLDEAAPTAGDAQLEPDRCADHAELYFTPIWAEVRGGRSGRAALDESVSQLADRQDVARELRRALANTVQLNPTLVGL